MNDSNNSQQEPSEGAMAEPSQGEPEPSSQGEPQGAEPKNQEGTSQWYKSKMDKLQKEYDEKLTQKEESWGREKQELTSQLQRISQDIEALKAPSQEEELIAPKLELSTGYDPDDPTQTIDRQDKTIKYLMDTIEYNSKANEKRFKQFEDRIGKTDQQLKQEQEQKKALQELEMTKSIAKGAWIQEGLTPEEAEECWNWQNTVKAEERIKAIGKLFKLSKGNGQDINDELKRRNEEKLDGAQPGAGAGGGSGEQVNPKEYTKTSDHTEMYKTN